jgi:hypothetical protein
VVRRDIHCISKNSKVYWESQIPYYLVPKMIYYYTVKQIHYRWWEIQVYEVYFLKSLKGLTSRRCNEGLKCVVTENSAIPETNSHFSDSSMSPWFQIDVLSYSLGLWAAGPHWRKVGWSQFSSPDCRLPVCVHVLQATIIIMGDAYLRSTTDFLWKLWICAFSLKLSFLMSSVRIMAVPLPTIILGNK